MSPDAGAGGLPVGFQSTLWTEILRAKDRTGPEGRRALEILVRNYWRPLYTFIRCKGHDAERGEDLVQGFFAAFLERDFLQYVDRGRGKFRTFLLTALEHYIADERDRAQAQKRGGGRPILSLDFSQVEAESALEPSAGDSAERTFLRQWALEVVGHALDAMRLEYEALGRVGEFEVLKSCLSLEGGETPSYRDVAAGLGVSENDVKNRLHAARRRFREAILAEIRTTTESEAEAAEELRDLLSAFAR